MGMREVHQCECAICQAADENPEKEHHSRMNLLLSRLDEQQRRWYVGVEAERMGHGGTELLSQITGINVNTIHKGREELARKLVDRPTDRVRVVGGGRKTVEKKVQ